MLHAVCSQSARRRSWRPTMTLQAGCKLAPYAGRMAEAALAHQFDLRDVYRDAGPAWSIGPARAYERIAATAIARLPGRLTGSRVLDLGAGAGAVSRGISRAGGSPVALDPSH